MHAPGPPDEPRNEDIAHPSGGRTMRVECPLCLGTFDLPPDARTEMHRTPDGRPRLEVRSGSALTHRCALGDLRSVP